MIWKTITLLSLALCVLGDEHAISEQKIKIIHKEHHKEQHKDHHGELSHIGSKKPEHHEEYAPSYPSYEFSYKVHDPHTHDMKGQEETRNGDDVKGEYWLIEPDGRKRIVTYHADHHSGFHATVQYSDDHHHHEHKKNEEGSNEEADGKKEDADEEGGEAKKGEGASKEEGAPVEEADAGGAEEESRRPEEVGRWIHDKHWGYRGKAPRRDIVQPHPYPTQNRPIVRENYFSPRYYRHSIPQRKRIY